MDVLKVMLQSSRRLMKSLYFCSCVLWSLESLVNLGQNPWPFGLLGRVKKEQAFHKFAPKLGLISRYATGWSSFPLASNSSSSTYGCSWKVTTVIHQEVPSCQCLRDMLVAVFHLCRDSIQMPDAYLYTNPRLIVAQTRWGSVIKTPESLWVPSGNRFCYSFNNHSWW